MYGIMLILILAVMGGAIAFIGDRLGTKVGKKKISLFGLRPRHTSMVMTVITGILIVTSTLGVMAVTSQDVRTALFGMERLKTELASLNLETKAKSAELEKARVALDEKNQEVATLDKSIAETRARLDAVAAELNSVQAERDRIQQELDAASERYETAREKLLDAEAAVARLETSKQALEASKQSLETDLARLHEITDQLRQGLTNVREGQVIYRAGEVVDSTVLPAGKSLTESRQHLGGFLTAANDNVLERLKVADKQLMVLWVSQSDYEQAAAALSAADNDQVVRVVAAGNIVYGEPVIVRLELYPNKLIYEKGTVVYQENILPHTSQENESAVMAALTKVNALAVKAGMLVDPLAGTVGALRASDIFEASQAIGREKGPVRIVVIAKDNIYTVGPLTVAIRVLPSTIQ